MSDAVTVSVQILGKPFQVSCGVDEAEQVTAAARLLDARMNEIHDTRKVLGFDRIAIMRRSTSPTTTWRRRPTGRASPAPPATRSRS